MKSFFLSLFLCMLTRSTNCKADSRVVGGENAPDKYPYQISLQIKMPGYVAFVQTNPDGWAHNCGGSIVTEKNVLTAAHCLTNYAPQNLSIWAGTTKLNGNGTRLFVDSFIIHDDYVALEKNDIGIITVKDSFVYSKKIQPIKYSDEEIGGGVECTLTGWGYITMIRVGRPPNDLQRIELPTVTNEECIEHGENPGPTEICTYTTYGKGACGGDSGGPLAKGDLLVGIVSYGTRLCGIGRPDVYTRVSKFYDWINSNIAK